MAKFYGEVGYLITEERFEDGIGTGEWEEHIVKHNYYGEPLNTYSRWQPGEGINDNINVSDRISIVADPFAFENFMHIKYVEYYGAKWKVEKIEVQRPRLILTLGGLYNEKETKASG